MTLFAKVTRAAFDATSKLLGVQLRADGDEGDDATAAGIDEQAAQYLSQLGVAVRPIVARTLRALGVEHGDEVLVLKLWDKARSPTDLDAGETRVFACGDITVALQMKTDGVVLTAKGATVTITSAGAVSVTAASGQDITLNAGTLKAARVTDPVRIGTIVATAGPYPVTFVTTLVDADGVPGTPTTSTTATLAGVVSNAGGAAHVKA